jgi:outer membrane protein assembly factor BamB
MANNAALADKRPLAAIVSWVTAALALLLSTFLASAAQYISSQEPGWPQFRGPHRDGISREVGLLQAWPEAGPPVLWSATNLGAGYSSPIISGDRIYITGDVGEELHIFAMDLEGRMQWKATNGAAWRNPFPGARASCTIAAGRIYHLNGHGQVGCYDAGDGRLVWRVDMMKEFESRTPTWGAAECLLVDGDRVVVTPGGRKASMAALDKTTGKTVWVAEPLQNEKSDIEGPAYASPVLVNVLGQRLVIGMTARHAFGVNADNGKLQWQFSLPTRYEVLASSPVVVDEGVFVTAPDANDGKFLRFSPRDGVISVEPAWTASLDTCHGGVIALDGFLYGSWYRSFNGWGCVNVKDGSVPYRDRELPMGSMLYADGRLYCLSQNGTMALVKPNRARWEIISQFEFAREPKKDVWAHPVILDGRLYLRHQQSLRCYDVRGRPPGT